MAWVTGAAIVGGALLGANASKKAGDTQADAAAKAAEVSQDQFNRTSRNLAPWMQTGRVALSQLAQGMGLNAPGSGQESYNWNGGTYKSVGDLRAAIEQNYVKESGGQSAYTPTVQASVDQWIDRIISEQPQQQQQVGTTGENGNNAPLLKPFGMQDFQESPAYQFNLQQGQKAIQKAAAARGTYYAPATLQDIGKYSQGLASNEFQNAYSNYNTNMNNIWQRLFAMSGTGQNAAVQQGGFGAAAAGQSVDAITGGAASNAAGRVGAANAINQGVGTGINAYMMNQILAGNQRSGVSLQSLPGMTGANDLLGGYA